MIMYTRFISGIRMQREDIKKKKKKFTEQSILYWPNKYLL